MMNIFGEIQLELVTEFTESLKAVKTLLSECFYL